MLAVLRPPQRGKEAEREHVEPRGGEGKGEGRGGSPVGSCSVFPPPGILNARGSRLRDVQSWLFKLHFLA